MNPVEEYQSIDKAINVGTLVVVIPDMVMASRPMDFHLGQNRYLVNAEAENYVAETAASLGYTVIGDIVYDHDHVLGLSRATVTVRDRRDSLGEHTVKQALHEAFGEYITDMDELARYVDEELLGAKNELYEEIHDVDDRHYRRFRSFRSETDYFIDSLKNNIVGLWVVWAILLIWLFVLTVFG